MNEPAPEAEMDASRLMMRGVIKIRSSVRLSVSEVLLKKYPRMGMDPKKGTLLIFCEVFRE